MCKCAVSAKQGEAQGAHPREKHLPGLKMTSLLG